VILHTIVRALQHMLGGVEVRTGESLKGLIAAYWRGTSAQV